MTTGLSLWLDVLRVLATVIVVLSHLAYPRFTDGDYLVIRELNLGSDAVIVFFVVSGVVIAYATDRDKDVSTFAFNRLTRLWSVLIPALFLTAAFDQWGFRLDPAAYPAAFFNDITTWELVLRGATFSNEFAIPERLRLGTNGPLWSLSYEAAYYALFGAAVFLTGLRRAAVMLLLLVLIGPRILLLMPAWLMGVWLWQQVRDGKLQNLSPHIAAICAALGPALYVVALSLNMPDMLASWTASTLGVPDARLVLGFSDEFIWNAMIGCLTILHIIGMMNLIRTARGHWTAIRWLAGASFSVYVTHYPALHLLDAALPADIAGRHLLLLMGCLGVGLVFAELFERRLGAIRAVFRRGYLPVKG